MSENEVKKIEFDGFIARGNWPILEPFTHDKNVGGFIEFGDIEMYAEPGTPADYQDPASWPPVRVRVTMEVIEPEIPVKPEKKKKEKKKK